MTKMTIQEIRAQIDMMEAAGVPQWKQQAYYEQASFERNNKKSGTGLNPPPTLYQTSANGERK